MLAVLHTQQLRSAFWVERWRTARTVIIALWEHSGPSLAFTGIWTSLKCQTIYAESITGFCSPHHTTGVRSGMFQRRHVLSSNSKWRKITQCPRWESKFLVYVLVTILLAMTKYLTEATQGRVYWPHRVPGHSTSPWGSRGSRNRKKPVTLGLPSGSIVMNTGAQLTLVSMISPELQLLGAVLSTFTLVFPVQFRLPGGVLTDTCSGIFPSDPQSWQWQLTITVEIIISHLLSLYLLLTR